MLGIGDMAVVMSFIFGGKIASNMLKSKSRDKNQT